MARAAKKTAAADPRVKPGGDGSAYEYRAPGRTELAHWLASPERIADWQRTFSGDVGQRVLFDLLHQVCGLASKPLPQPGVTLDRLVGRQDVAVDILEILSVSPREVTQANIRSHQYED